MVSQVQHSSNSAGTVRAAHFLGVSSEKWHVRRCAPWRHVVYLRMEKEIVNFLQDPCNL